MRAISLTAALIATLVLVAVPASHAQVVPFKASGDNAEYTPDDGQTSGYGKATHMGRAFGSGEAIPGAMLGPGLFAWTATNYQLTAANGDQIFFNGGGTVQFIPLPMLGPNMFYAEWTGDFNVVDGNGRFEHVKPGSEPLVVTATNDPFELDAMGNPLPGDTWTYSWTLNGKIKLGKRK